MSTKQLKNICCTKRKSAFENQLVEEISLGLQQRQQSGM